MTLFNPPNYAPGKGPAPHLIDEETGTQTGERTCAWPPCWEFNPEPTLSNRPPTYSFPPVSISVPKRHFPEKACSARCSWLPGAASLHVLECCWAPCHAPCKVSCSGGGRRSISRVCSTRVRRDQAAILSSPSSPRSFAFQLKNAQLLLWWKPGWLCLGPIAPNPF